MTRLMIALIRAYQALLSPVLPPSCRFTPTCSQFAIEAYRLHGFWTGSRLAVGRLLRCGPWTHGGYDPVPPKNQRGSTESQLHVCPEVE